MEPLAEERNHLQSVDGSPAGTEHAGWVALHERRHLPISSFADASRTRSAGYQRGWKGTMRDGRSAADLL